MQISAKARSRCSVVLAFRRGSDAEQASSWRRTLERGEASDADLEHAIGLMVKHRALEDSIGRAHHYGAIARDALALFPDSKMESRGWPRTAEFCNRADALSSMIRKSGIRFSEKIMLR